MLCVTWHFVGKKSVSFWIFKITTDKICTLMILRKPDAWHMSFSDKLLGCLSLSMNYCLVRTDSGSDSLEICNGSLTFSSVYVERLARPFVIAYIVHHWRLKTVGQFRKRIIQKPMCNHSKESWIVILLFANKEHWKRCVNINKWRQCVDSLLLKMWRKSVEVEPSWKQISMKCFP